MLSAHTCPVLSLVTSSRFTHVRARREAFVHADRWSWNVKGAHCAVEQCFLKLGYACKYTCASPFKFRFTRTHMHRKTHGMHTHTHTQWHIQTSPLLSAAYQRAQANNCTNTWARSFNCIPTAVCDPLHGDLL